MSEIGHFAKAAVGLGGGSAIGIEGGQRLVSSTSDVNVMPLPDTLTAVQDMLNHIGQIGSVIMRKLDVQMENSAARPQRSGLLGQADQLLTTAQVLLAAVERINQRI